MSEAYGFSWKWATPAITVVVITAVVGAVIYPGLPERLPVHFSATGEADSFWPTSLFSVFAIVGVQVLLLPLLFAASSARFRQMSSGGDFATFGRTMLLFAASVELALTVAALTVWQLLPSGWWTVPLSLLPIVVGLGYLLVQNLRHAGAES